MVSPPHRRGPHRPRSGRCAGWWAHAPHHGARHVGADVPALRRQGPDDSRAAVAGTCPRTPARPRPRALARSFPRPHRAGAGAGRPARGRPPWRARPPMTAPATRRWATFLGRRSGAVASNPRRQRADAYETGGGCPWRRGNRLQTGRHQQWRRCTATAAPAAASERDVCPPPAASERGPRAPPRRRSAGPDGRTAAPQT